ncbi:nucleoside 2-deoxyribosyltransferase [Candidatus Dactylopiibacterium carminicum]|uniref:nucleoside 2-deoxyribosyltransferase n=1 Tax=Candidatus Dactylopiibacterium carminicum TaxID=857335 RepID=UPI001EF79064|nr:nucleoside 2-deoxyribosyltransferase [Candidatus Dactylopiibacterium carminicum]
MKLYLAGPDVFRADALAWADEVRAKCRAHGHEALVPLDGGASTASEIYAQNLALIAAADVVLANISTSFAGQSRIPAPVSRSAMPAHWASR